MGMNPAEKLEETFDPEDVVIHAVKEKIGLSAGQIKAANLIYWLTCLCEYLIANPSAVVWGDIAKKGGYEHGEVLTKYMFYEMGFYSKIKVLRKQIELLQIDPNKNKPFLSFCEKLNSVRNPIAHYKFTELQWNGESLEKAETRKRAVMDFIEMTEKMAELHK